MRLSLTLGLALISSGAFASFELALIGDSTQKVIHRYDTETGAYLGSFGRGTLPGVSAMAINQTLGQVITYDRTSGWMTRHNYSTGELLASSSIGVTPGLGVSIKWNTTTGDLWVASSGGTLLRVDPMNLFTTGVLGFTGTSLVTGGAGTYAYNATTNRIASLSYNSSNSVITATDQSTAVALTAPGRALSTGSMGFYATIEATAPPRLRLFSPTTIYGNVKNFSMMTSLITAAKGHAGSLYGLGVNGATPVFSRALADDFLTGYDIDTMNISQVTTPADMVIAVAPEPGTLAALSLGALALMRRRKAQ